MTLEEFTKLVAEMRAMQKAYFRRRTPEALETSKQLEKRVDEALEQLTDKSRTLF